MCKGVTKGVRYLICENDWMSEVNFYSGVYDSTDRSGGLIFTKIHYYSQTDIRTFSVQDPTTRFSTVGLTLFRIHPKLNDNLLRYTEKFNYGGQYKKSRKNKRKSSRKSIRRK